MNKYLISPEGHQVNNTIHLLNLVHTGKERWLRNKVLAGLNIRQLNLQIIGDSNVSKYSPFITFFILNSEWKNIFYEITSKSKSDEKYEIAQQTSSRIQN